MPLTGRVLDVSTAQLRILLAPNFVAAIKTVDVAEIFFDKKLCGALAAVAVVTTYDQRNIEIGVLYKALYGLVVNMQGIVHVAGLKTGFIANIDECHGTFINHIFRLLHGNTFEIEH